MISSRLVEINHALEIDRKEWFPADKKRRYAQNVKLAEMVGVAISIFDDWSTYARSSYGRFIVLNSQDETGIALVMNQWLRSVRKGARNE